MAHRCYYTMCDSIFPYYIQAYDCKPINKLAAFNHVLKFNSFVTCLNSCWNAYVMYEYVSLNLADNKLQPL